MMFLLRKMMKWREKWDDVDTDSWLKLDDFGHEM